MFSIHHLTHIENLENILKNGLVSRNYLKKQYFNFTDTAENDIIIKRGYFNNYIPFHFTFIQEKYGIPYNYAVCKKENPENIVFLVITTQQEESKYFIFRLYHPVSSYSKVLNNFSNFKTQFDEEIENYKNEMGIINFSEQEVKNLFMSEFLLKFTKIPINNRWKIYVYSQSVKDKIEDIFKVINVNKSDSPEIIVDDKKIFFRNL